MSDPRDQRITELEAENAALRARTAELEKKVEELTQLVLMLKERLDRNSGNSSAYSTHADHRFHVKPIRHSTRSRSPAPA